MLKCFRYCFFFFIMYLIIPYKNTIIDPARVYFVISINSLFLSSLINSRLYQYNLCVFIAYTQNNNSINIAFVIMFILADNNKIKYIPNPKTNVSKTLPFDQFTTDLFCVFMSKDQPPSNIINKKHINQPIICFPITLFFK